jgi:hypothetical protein
MKVQIEECERYPVYEVFTESVGEPLYEVPDELVKQAKDNIAEFERIQKELTRIVEAQYRDEYQELKT